MRPANIVTSIADVLAGIAISGYLLQPFLFNVQLQNILLLSLSTVGLYGGGVVFNDVFDAELDKIERPERAIPSGRVTVNEAMLLGIILLIVGIVTSFFVNIFSGSIATTIAAAALIYDKWGKHQKLIGPLNMGLCRGLNLLLGVSILITQISSYWYVALVPIIYIAAVTIISRGEVHGGKSTTFYIAAALYLLVISAIFIFSFYRDKTLLTVVFLLPFAWMIFTPLYKAWQEPIGKNIGKAVKAGVIALILLNACWAAAFGAFGLALIIVLLLPLSLFLAKKFAVT